MNYTETMLIQFTFFGAYAIMSMPAAWIIGKIGYQKGIVLGLSVAGSGALLFYPASIVMVYPVFLLAFFILATGITILQVAANPYVTILGKAETASSRLTLTQAFNSLGTYVAPLVGGMLILGGTYYAVNQEAPVNQFNSNDSLLALNQEQSWQQLPGAPNNVVNTVADKSGHLWLQKDDGSLILFDGNAFVSFPPTGQRLSQASKGIVVAEADADREIAIEIISNENYDTFQTAKSEKVQLPYVVFAGVFFLIAMFFFFTKLPVISEAMSRGNASGSAYQYRHLTLGAGAIFLYVGAEVSIGSFLINFFADRDIAAMSEAVGAKYVAIYWGSAMIGRFLGSISMAEMSSNAKRYGLMALIAGLGFLLAFYTTGWQLSSALVYLAFVALNVLAALLGANKPGRTLGIYALFASALVFATTLFTGMTAVWAIIVVGLFNSIMFPTIFALAVSGLGPHTSQGSGALNTAIVGGAIVPLLMGALADSIGLHSAFILPALCYLYIAFYGFIGSVPQTEMQ
jgi:FHS family L-fucose permease-like MFS transporter